MSENVMQLMMNGITVIGTWPTFAILFLLCALFFGYLVPKTKAPIFANVPKHMPHKVLDEAFPSWTPRMAQDFLAEIGPEGRAAYRRFYLTMDFWFPGAIASLTTASLMLIAFPPASPWAWLCLLALPAWLFDAAENVTHFQMTKTYPNLPSFTLKFGPLFTGAKWLFAIVPVPIALVGLVLRLFH